MDLPVIILSISKEFTDLPLPLYDFFHKKWMADENQLSPVVCEKIFVFAVVFFLHYEQGCLQPFQAVLLYSKTNFACSWMYSSSNGFGHTQRILSMSKWWI